MALIQRFPKSTNKSLRAWSAADELLLAYAKENNTSNPIIFNDSFGYLSVHLIHQKPQSICHLKSQQNAIKYNLADQNIHLLTPFDSFITTDLALIKVPKSMDLFDLFLQKTHSFLGENGQVLAGFMTRHFNDKMIKIAEKYFHDVSQTRAKKKARLIVMKNKKEVQSQNLFNQMDYHDFTFRQYYGVFSASNIDYATQFLVEHLLVPQGKKIGLDLASGNGVLAHQLLAKNPQLDMHLLDDSILAIESSKLNVSKAAHFHWNHELGTFKDDFFDFVISNPPFHLEHEIDLSLPLGLFKSVSQKLKSNGIFQLVANRHLNYQTHLKQWFNQVDIQAENPKFVIYKCTK